MSDSADSDRHLGSLTVLDLMLLVAASSVSILLVRLMRPAVPTAEDYLLLTAYCGPAGLSVFGPWAIRRQFAEGSREEMETGEWLWIALAGAWIAATPLLLVTGGKAIPFFSGLLAVFGGISGLIALVQSIPIAGRLPWTHWAGVLLCLTHAMPVLLGFGPTIWALLDDLLSWIGILF